jgi:hypothetical protein
VAAESEVKINIITGVTSGIGDGTNIAGGVEQLKELKNTIRTSLDKVAACQGEHK